MATRLYFPANTAAEVTPVANGAWGYTTEALNRKLVPTTKSNTALADGSQIGAWTSGQTALDRRYVSPPLDGAQTLSGTVACVLMAREFNNGDNTTSRMEIYVVNQAGDTVRGTALAIGQYGPATEMLNNATLRNKRYADGDTLSSVSCSDGDRVVVCIGYTDAAGSTPEGQCKYGDPTAGTDLAENETNTTANPGWIEFSATLTFQAGVVYEGEVITTGTSSTSASGTRSTAGVSPLTGTGTLTSAATATYQGAAALLDNNVLSAVATKALLGAAVLGGAGGLTAGATVEYASSASLTGAGALTADATVVYEGSATLAGSGILTADGAIIAIYQGTVAIVAGPAVVATANVIKNVQISHRGGSTSRTDGV